jgi:hypothetical protein
LAVFSSRFEVREDDEDDEEEEVWLRDPREDPPLRPP